MNELSQILQAPDTRWTVTHNGYGNLVVTCAEGDIRDLVPELRAAGIAYAQRATVEGVASLVIAKSVEEGALVAVLREVESRTMLDTFPVIAIKTSGDGGVVGDQGATEAEESLPADDPPPLATHSESTAVPDSLVVSGNATSTARVRKHREKIGKDCTRLDITIGTDVAEKVKALAQKTGRPMWSVVEAALEEMDRG